MPCNEKCARPSERPTSFCAAIIGAGFAGSVVAERLASAGHPVLVIDQRPHIGGNAYDEPDAHGVLIHRYGPHIFHTNAQRVVDYLSRFTDWLPYEHRVLASVDGQLLPIPINQDTINRLYNLHLDEAGVQAFFDRVREPRDPIQTSEDVVLNTVGRDLYEKFFRGYTRKQWGLDPSQLSAAVTARIPVRTNRDNRYFNDQFQIMRVSRFPWNSEFPPVWIHATESAVKRHLSYVAAKAGDPDEAFRLINDTLSADVVGELLRTFQGRQPILVSAHAIEGTGVNAIPEVLADVLSQQSGWRVDSGIVQTNIVAHTGANGFSRLARQARFDGPVIAGDEYILVDDFVGQGGTLANMRAHILSAGGTVIGATVLTGKPYSAYLQLKADTLEKLRLKHGKALEIWWKQHFGFEFDCLTESEARYLLNTPDAERIRNRIVAAIKA